MHAEDAPAHDRSDGQAVEHIAEALPHFNSCPSLACIFGLFTLLVKTVLPVEFRTLVVAPQHEDGAVKFYFVGQK